MPVECVTRNLRIEEIGRSGLDIADEIRSGAGAWVNNQQMDVIGDGTGAKERSAAFLHNPADVGVQFVAEGVDKKRFAVLRRKHKVDEDAREGLRHDKNVMMRQSCGQRNSGRPFGAENGKKIRGMGLCIGYPGFRPVGLHRWAVTVRPVWG